MVASGGHQNANVSHFSNILVKDLEILLDNSISEKKNAFSCGCSPSVMFIANEPAERRREAGEAAAL